MPSAFTSSGPVELVRVPKDIPDHLWILYRFVTELPAGEPYLLEKRLYTSARTLAKSVADDLLYVHRTGGTAVSGRNHYHNTLIYYSPRGMEEDPYLDLLPLVDPVDPKGTALRIQAAFEKWHP